MTLLGWIISVIAWAGSCPEGKVLAKSGKFSIEFGSFVNGNDRRQCRVEGDSISSMPLEIVGCFPNHPDAEYLLLKAPEGWTHKCFQSPPENFIVRTEEFHPIGSKAEPCIDNSVPIREESAAAAYSNRKNAINFLIQDYAASENQLKSVRDVEKYHDCLLSGSREERQSKAYRDKYRFHIEEASASFGVPLSLLTCLCGRESRFKADNQSHTGAKGVCQATDANLKDVEKWRQKVPVVKEMFEKYTRTLAQRGKLEHAGCANAPLSKDLLVRCPSLGFGAAAVYLLYAYGRVENSRAFKNLHWEANGLDTLVSLAASYNVGVEFSSQVLQDVRRHRWARNLLNSTCTRFGKGKFDELRSHMFALRSCLHADSWLDHQGKALGGSCTPKGLALANQRASLEQYQKSMPGSCGQ